MRDWSKGWSNMGYTDEPDENAKQVRCDRPGCPMCNPEIVTSMQDIPAIADELAREAASGTEPAHRARTWPDLDLTEFPPPIVLFAAFAGGAVFGFLVMLVIAAGNGWIR